MKVDHINPASWRGSILVESVNLHTCWLLEYQKAVQLIPETEGSLHQLQKMGFNMLAPLGNLLINQCDGDDEFDCSELEKEYDVDDILN